MTINISNLRCEYLVDPLGVDTPEPRFSWQLEDPYRVRGRKQGAYQVVVERMLGERRTTLWDSGQVDSNQSVNVVYGGVPLSSAWDCRWRVRAWDEEGAVSPWSDEARFVMGLLESEDWSGDWIRAAQAEEHQHVWFRKAFVVNSLPPSSFAYVCSIGYHELYVNGTRIGDAVLTPGVTNLAKRALYITYDIRDALQSGENVIALWTGPGWARADGSYGKGVWDQAAMFQCRVALGEMVSMHSDASWRCAVSSSENIGLWKGGGQGTYGGERIDARLHLAGWNTVEFDDSSWTSAATASQAVKVSSALFEPDRKVETLIPVSIEATGKGYVIDMGQNYTGWFEIDLRGGAEGEVVRLLTANRAGERVEYDQESEYIFDASGEGTFCHRFNWMAGRWITVEGLPRAPQSGDVRGYIVTNDRRRTGHFECSSDQLNAIYEADLRTYIANTVNGAVMDCPHRERYGYGEVALACTWGCGVPNYESAAFYTKATRDWFDVQSEDGMVNTIAPQPYLGAGGTLWSSAPLTMSWEHYRAYGDRRLLEQAYPVMKRWLDYLHAAVTEDGVLMPYSIVSRFLGDWATPHGNEYGDSPEAQLFNNCVYAYDLMVFVQAAEILGHTEDAAVYGDRLAELRDHAHAWFYDENQGQYVDGLQLSMLFPLYTRITPEPLREKVFDTFARGLTEQGYLDTGSSGLPIMLKYVTEDLGKPELLLPALERTSYPGYGFFLARGESTWPEYWEIDGITSRIHTCYTSIAGYFVKGIGGIQCDPDAPGMQRFLVRPHLAGELSYANTATESLYGRLVCNWKRTQEATFFRIEVPPNTMAEIRLPGVGLVGLTEGGMVVEKVKGIRLIEADDEAVVLEVGAGAYHFNHAS